MKEFLMPSVYSNASFLFTQIGQKENEYIYKFIKIDENKNIVIPELLTIDKPSFLYKEYLNYQNIMENSVFNYINKKKYKNVVIREISWELSFDSLVTNIIME